MLECNRQTWSLKSQWETTATAIKLRSLQWVFKRTICGLGMWFSDRDLPSWILYPARQKLNKYNTMQCNAIRIKKWFVKVWLWWEHKAQHSDWGWEQVHRLVPLKENDYWRQRRESWGGGCLLWVPPSASQPQMAQHGSQETCSLPHSSSPLTPPRALHWPNPGGSQVCRNCWYSCVWVWSTGM
jgi:hypothetical protein